MTEWMQSPEARLMTEWMQSPGGSGQPHTKSPDCRGSGCVRVHVLTESQLSEIDRNARAYGWDIGRGTPIAEVIESGEGNPFLDHEWRLTAALAPVEPATEEADQ